MPELKLFNQRNFFKLNSLILLLILLFSITACNDSEDTVPVIKSPPRIPRVYINTEGNFEFKDDITYC